MSCLLTTAGTKIWKATGCVNGVQSGTTCATLPVCTGTGFFLQWTGTAFVCGCNVAPNYQTVACDAGYTGTKYQRQDYDCASKAYGPWTDVSSNCTSAPTCTWAYRDTGKTSDDCSSFTYSCNGVDWANANHPCGPSENGHTVSVGRGKKPRYLCSCK